MYCSCRKVILSGRDFSDDVGRAPLGSINIKCNWIARWDGIKIAISLQLRGSRALCAWELRFLSFYHFLVVVQSPVRVTPTSALSVSFFLFFRFHLSLMHILYNYVRFVKEDTGWRGRFSMSSGIIIFGLWFSLRAWNHTARFRSFGKENLCPCCSWHITSAFRFTESKPSSTGPHKIVFEILHVNCAGLRWQNAFHCTY